MTRKEAFFLVEERECIDCRNESCENCKTSEALCIAAKTLKQADKYRWHDLRKDPEDLPEEHKIFIAYDLLGKTIYDTCYFGDPIVEPPTKEKVFYTCDSEWGDVEIEDVIAWKYIEPFKEYEND